MADNKKKKKWYDTWWGLLWTLALVDANPGRGLRAFMEMDEELQDLDTGADEKPALKPSKSRAPQRATPCPVGATNCKV